MLKLKKIDIEKPVFSKYDICNVKNYINKKQINIQKTIVLFPLSNSFFNNSISSEFWVGLANIIISKGYNVFINYKEVKKCNVF